MLDMFSTPSDNDDIKEVMMLMMNEVMMMMMPVPFSPGELVLHDDEARGQAAQAVGRDEGSLRHTDPGQRGQRGTPSGLSVGCLNLRLASTPDDRHSTHCGLPNG
jgi:hypothetical protein